MIRFFWLFFFTLSFSGCSAKDKNKDILIIFNEIPITASYIVNFAQIQAVGWSDSFQSGVVVFDNSEGVDQLLSKSQRINSGEYIPLKGTPLELASKDVSVSLWVYKSKGKRDRRLYYIIQGERVIFDLLVL